MKWQFNKKNTTYALYACGVILFAVLCISFLVNKDSYHGVLDTIRSIFDPIFFGIIIAYLLNPILRLSEKLYRKAFGKKLGNRGIRALGLTTTYILFLALVTAFLAILLPQLIGSVEDLVDQSVSLINSIPLRLQELIDTNEAFAELYDLLVNNFDIVGKLSALTDRLGDLLMSSLDILLGLVATVKNLALGLFFSVYFLASKELLINQIKRFFLAFFSFKQNVALGHFMTTVDMKFGQFIRGKILDSTIVMVIVYILCWIFQMPYYPMIALIVGVTDLIPVFGPFLGAIPSGIIILISPAGGFSKALLFALLILIVQQIDGNIIAPNILGDKVGISGVWIMVAIVLMGGLFGIFGMFFGVPVFAVIYTLVGEAIHKKLLKKGLAEQMDDEQIDPPENKPNLFMRIKNRIFSKKAVPEKVTPEEEDEDDLIK